MYLVLTDIINDTAVYYWPNAAGAKDIGLCIDWNCYEIVWLWSVMPRCGHCLTMFQKWRWCILSSQGTWAPHW